MNYFLDAWLKLGLEEKGYSNNPHDAGGETNWGITVAVARAHGYQGEMKDMPQDTARDIAKKSYWDLMRLDDVAALSPSIAVEMFDSGFNVGQATEGMFLQHALNVFNRGGKDYVELKVDGLIGAQTIYALKCYLNKRGKDGEIVMLRALNTQQGGYYLQLAAVNPNNEDFEFGWFLNRIS